MTSKPSPLEIRIQKAIAQSGIASRRKAETLIEEGKVRLNGKVVQTLGMKVKVGIDVIEVENQVVPWKLQHRVAYALYKPKRCITSVHDPEGRLTIKEFFPKTKGRLFPVGRLDYETEGLILITNDGELSQSILHPKYKIWKTYFVKVKGKPTDEDLKPLRKGIRFKGVSYGPMQIKHLHHVNEKTWLEVSIYEGKNRQIRKTFEAIRCPVEKLKRFRIAHITLEGLTPGEHRALTEGEIEKFIKPKR